jgi:nickel transport protein
MIEQRSQGSNIRQFRSIGVLIGMPWIDRTLRMIILICIAMLLANSVEVHAHGVNAGYIERTGIEVVARYDTGHPMSGARVSVFAPDNPATPWKTSTLDENGRFLFVPDPVMPGTWSVQVRQEGHGAMIHIPVGESVAREVQTGPVSLTLLQRILVAASICWGGIGTALYFSRKRRIGN